MDVNLDAQISFDEFHDCLSRWVDEKLRVHASNNGQGGKGSGHYSALLDPHEGGPMASLLADLPPEDLKQLRVSCKVLMHLTAACSFCHVHVQLILTPSASALACMPSLLTCASARMSVQLCMHPCTHTCACPTLHPAHTPRALTHLHACTHAHAPSALAIPE